MRTLRVLVAVFATALGSCGWLQAQQPGVQALEWNVFLSDWQILGPFPKESAQSTGLDTAFVADEANLRGGQVAFYKDKLYTWKPNDERVINFRRFLKVQGPPGDNVVAYAWTQFTSPVAQKATLAVGYDDMFVAWVNGKEACRGTQNWAASLDQELAEVELRQGVNTLLLKVANGVRAWDAVARFLPAGLKEPLLTFKILPAGDIYRLPAIDVTLLDAQGKTVSRHRTSGLRKSWPGVGAYYALYAPLPAQPPASVRLSFQEPGFKAFSQTFTWNRVRRGDLALKLESERPLELLVVDQKSRKPIAGAEIWSGQTKEPVASNEQGRITMPEFSPLANQCWVAAPGYAAQKINLVWPRGNLQRVELVPGGKTITGTVLSTTGEPLEGATVDLGTSGFAPQTVTDKEGRFELFGLPPSTTEVYPVIQCRGYVSKDRFAFRLSDGPVTKAVWELTPGATITGRVTHRDTGSPLAGITITMGQDRFGSNNKNPTTTTDAQGRYELLSVPAGAGLLHAFSDNHAPAMQAVTASLGSTVEANFQLSDGKPVTGIVTDTQGKPLAGVRLVTDTWNGARMFQRETRSDDAGRFTLPHMPEIAAEVDILKSGYVSQRRYAMRGGDVVNLQLKPVVTYTIQVRDAKGQIVPGVQIAKGYLWNGNGEWQWSSSEWETGRLYNKLSGTLKVEFDEPFNGEIAYRFLAAGYQPEIVRIPRNAEQSKNITVQLKLAAVFEGRVVDALNGEPLPGVAVAMVSQEDRLRSDHYVDFMSPAEYLKRERFTGQTAVTDARGRFRMSPPMSATPADLVLIARDGGFHHITGLEQILRSQADSNTVLELPLPASGSIQGQLMVAGKPQPNSRVHLHWLGHGVQRESDESFGVGGQVVTDADGRFRYPRLGPGRYRLSRVFTATLGQGRSTSMYLDSVDVVLMPGQTLVKNLERPAGMSISGTTCDADGKPVANCIISATRTDDNRHRVAAAQSDGDGRYVLEHLPPGAYQLSAEHYGRHPQGYSINDLHGSAAVELTSSRDGVRIELSAVDQGQPQPVTSLVGSLAPEFSATAYGASEPFTLSRHFGKVVAVAFWGTWSNDLAGIRQAFNKYKDHSDVAFFTVFLQDEEQFRNFVKTQPVDFPVAVDGGSETSLAARFGIWGNPTSLVIGRDGRFASQRLSSNNLADAIELALAQPLEPALTHAQPAQLEINVTADAGDRGVPGAQLVLKAIDAAGRSVREDKVVLPSSLRRVVWRYPATSSRVMVTLTGRGIEEQTQTVNRPSPTEKLDFTVSCPRLLSGRVVGADRSTPIAGVQVRIRSSVGETWTMSSDAQGRFTLACFPGTYYVSVVASDKYAPVGNLQSVNVADAADPKPLELNVAPAIRVQGRVVDAAGKPVAGATVVGHGESGITTDEDGRFSMEGIASVGTTQLWAMSNEVYGAIRLKNPQADQSYTITLGKGLNEEANAMLSPGSRLQAFEAWTLAGEKVTWQPTAEKDRLLVFCPLWHPASRAFLQRAQNWANEHGGELELICLDWSLEQARRELQTLAFQGRVLYAGPNWLRLGETWSNDNSCALLIRPDGTLAAMPLQ